MDQRTVVFFITYTVAFLAMFGVLIASTFNKKIKKHGKALVPSVFIAFILVFYSELAFWEDNLVTKVVIASIGIIVSLLVADYFYSDLLYKKLVEKIKN
ncbi:MAG: hypothetical protein A2Y57_04845 [Candidatus Woykebacteria bacterium RBG_13_40_7b]|uniref:Uncharacterized protein n=1 Tax=Candidatus Woykebacteria bacterium RBG_13_40_7b TaxID=1802594 RepID=A0A1G1WBV6_9BACT|nr:MAG: hypothetical protein A2Y57_04845 [Candidatus Woykebacteria bacterium RBG_13_40_7b]